MGWALEMHQPTPACCGVKAWKERHHISIAHNDDTMIIGDDYDTTSKYDIEARMMYGNGMRVTNDKIICKTTICSL